MNREDATALAREYTRNENLMKHMFAVAAAMRAYAEKFGEDPEKWEVCGILHDFDYEKFGEEHPSEWGMNELRERGIDEDIVEAIAVHGERENPGLRKTKMAQTLCAVDELTGLIVACALVRPDKLASLEVPSIKKRMKKKDFAKGVNRDDITNGAAEIGVEIDDHLQIVLDAMKGIREELGL